MTTLTPYAEIESRIKKFAEDIKDNEQSGFCTNVFIAVKHRNETLNFIKEQFITPHTEDNDHQDIESISKIMEDIVRDNIATVVIMGKVNSGKSLLISQLLGIDWQLVPSCGEHCTKLPTRYRFNSTMNHIEIQLKTFVNDGKEKIIEQSEIATVDKFEKTLKEYWEKERSDEEFIFVDVVLNNCSANNESLCRELCILDCPGLDETTVDESLMNNLRYFNPSVICYVYDNRRKFNQKDDQYLIELAASLNLYDSYGCCVNAILVANFDDFDPEKGRFDDSNKRKTELSDLTLANICEQNNHGGINYFKFLGGKCELPIFRVSAGELFVMTLSRLEDNENKDRLILLQQKIVEFIGRQVLSFCDILAFYLYKSRGSKFLNSWFQLKSLTTEKSFIQRLETEFKSPNKCVVSCSSRYNVSYSYFTMVTNHYLFHATRISSAEQNLMTENWKQERIRICCENSGIIQHISSLIYESEDCGFIYVIDQEMLTPNGEVCYEKLIDCDHPFNIDRILLDIISRSNSLEELARNFSPDNVFICRETEKIYVNRNIPNFNYKHPKLRKFDNYWNDQYSFVEFIYSFGEFIKLLLLKDKQNGANHWSYEIMEKCLQVELKFNGKKVKKYWREEIENPLKIFAQLANRSDIDFKFIDEIETNCRDPEETHKLFFLEYKEALCKSGESVKSKVESQTQVTVIQEKTFDALRLTIQRIYYNRPRFDKSKLIVHFNPYVKKLYIVERPAYHKQVMAHLDQISMPDAERIIFNIADQCKQIDKLHGNFQPDKVYYSMLDDEKSGPLVHLNLNFPSKCMDNPDHPIFENPEFNNIISSTVKFVYNFGWFIWRLITKKSYSDKEKLIDQKSLLSEVTNESWRRVIELCWNITSDGCDEQWRQVQSEIRTLHQNATSNENKYKTLF